MPGATVRPTMRQFYLRGGGRAAPPCPQTPCPRQQPPSTLKPWVQTSDLTSGGPLVVVVMVVLGVNVSFVFQAGRQGTGCLARTPSLNSGFPLTPFLIPTHASSLHITLSSPRVFFSKYREVV